VLRVTTSRGTGGVGENCKLGSWRSGTRVGE